MSSSAASSWTASKDTGSRRRIRGRICRGGWSEFQVDVDMGRCRYDVPPGALLLHDGFQLARVGGKALDVELLLLWARRAGPITSSNRLRHPVPGPHLPAGSSGTEIRIPQECPRGAKNKSETDFLSRSPVNCVEVYKLGFQVVAAILFVRTG